MTGREVGVFRLQLFKPSEGFIQSQAEALRRFRPVYVGRKRFGPAPAQARVATPNARTGWARVANFVRIGALRQPEPFLHAWPAPGPAPALIHAHFAIDSVFALPLAKQLGVPLLTTLHGFDVTRAPQDMLRSGRPSLVGGVLWRKQLQAQGRMFLCVSEFIRRAAIASGFPAERLRVHYIGIDCTKLALRDHAGEDGLVVHVARLVEKKGTAYLLRAFAGLRTRHPAARLVVIGDGPLRPSLEALSRDLGIADAVEFKGVMRNEQVLHWIARAAVMVVPSVTAADGDAEGLPIVNLEACAQGVPLVAFDSGGIAEAVEHGYSGFLSEERDIDGLQSHIDALLSDSSLRMRVGGQARRLVEQRFNIQKQTAELEDIYDELAPA